MENKKNKQQSIVIYTSGKGNVELQADIHKETIWASLDQIAELFGRDKSVVSRHLKSIFTAQELDKNSVVAKNATTAADGKTYIVEYYNLDAILSVGYRVNSKKATQFRIWATKTLKDYILKGAAFNADRIKKLHEAGLKDLDEKIKFIQNTIRTRQLGTSEVEGLLSVISGYANSWTLLKRYDEGDIILVKGKGKEKKHFDYEFVRPAVDELKNKLMEKGEASDLFASERDGSFQGILKTIYQTFGGNELYGSLEEKAAHLLYFIIKDHPFSDGNKRVGSFLFILFLDQNRILRRKDGENKINDNTLVALALLVAESDPKDKEMMVALISNLLT